eukprot:Em0001g1124a
MNAINSYSCTCAPGFTGRNCATTINYCKPQPCKNGGTCVNGNGSFTCLCPPTYGEVDCSTRVCTSSYCLNGGTCSSSLNLNIQCRCPQDTSGNQCEFSDRAVTDFVAAQNGNVKIGGAVGSTTGIVLVLIFAGAAYVLYRHRRKLKRNKADPGFDSPAYSTLLDYEAAAPEKRGKYNVQKQTVDAYMETELSGPSYANI